MLHLAAHFDCHTPIFFYTYDISMPSQIHY